MRILLDTHIWIRMIEAPGSLSSAVRRLVSPVDTECFLSAASSMEIATKLRIGKLRLSDDPANLTAEWMIRANVLPLAVQHRHALAVASLPPHHRDPFDRLLIAQARMEDLTILTADRVFERYDVKVKRP